MRSQIKFELRGLYAISDEILTPYKILPQALETILKAGVRIFQLRDKAHSDSWLYPRAIELMKLCEKYNALFVLNDRLSLALQLNAPALHLGKNDGEIIQARKHFKGILGASSYADLSRACLLQKLGVDYVTFGAFFSSSTKPNAPLAPLKILESTSSILHIPICAIGGISNENIHMLKNVHMHAVINSIWNRDITQTISQQLDSIDSNAQTLLSHY